jgi:hypothetical protein
MRTIDADPRKMAILYRASSEIIFARGWFVED